MSKRIIGIRASHVALGMALVVFSLMLVFGIHAWAADEAAISNQPVADGAAVSNQPAAESKEITWEVYEYQSFFRRDPFKTLIRLDSDAPGLDAPPLQRYDLSQMKLVAVVLEVGTRYALVKIPDGSHHTIKVDDRLGIHDGVVQEIMQSMVVVREKKYDYRHNLIDSYYEMKLREEEGK